MNGSLALSMFSIIAVSLPAVSVADDRLDAPGPGYRQQVERFAPLQIEPTSFFIESPVMIRTGEWFSITPISAPGVSFEADRLEAPDPGYREQVERFSRDGNGAAPFRLELRPPRASTEFPARMPKGNAAFFLHAVEFPSGIAPRDDFDFFQPIRLFDLPRTFGSGVAPGMSIPAR